MSVLSVAHRANRGSAVVGALRGKKWRGEASPRIVRMVDEGPLRLHSTARQCTTALHGTARQRTTALHCTARQRTTALHCTARHGAAQRAHLVAQLVGEGALAPAGAAFLAAVCDENGAVRQVDRVGHHLQIRFGTG